MKSLAVIVGALLLPTVAFADSPVIVNPPPPPPPQPVQPAPQPAPPTVINNTQQNTQPQPAPAPTTIVQEPSPAPIVNQPSPEYTEVYDSYNAPIFTSGALVFAASYGASVAVASSTDNDNGIHHLYVPVVGPWLALNARPSCDAALSRCDNETSKKVLLVADGIFQAAGVITMIDGILQPSHHRVFATTAKIDAKLHHPRPIAIGPESTPGLGFSGHW